MATYNHVIVQGRINNFTYYGHHGEGMSIHNLSEEDALKIGVFHEDYLGGWKVYNKSPAKVLDDLGKLGFKVAGFGCCKDPDPNNITDMIFTWTLTKKINRTNA